MAMPSPTFTGGGGGGGNNPILPGGTQTIQIFFTPAQVGVTKGGSITINVTAPSTPATPVTVTLEGIAK
jgi:hypothetical protein